jgi:hypothetical protein
MGQIKDSFLKKKTTVDSSRNIWLRNPSEIKTILLVSNEESKSLKKMVEEVFSSSKVHHLFTRPIKQDSTVGFYYSVHPSDFNLTGKLKNDKLSNLENMPFELLIDLSSDTEILNYFISRSSVSLKVGKLNCKHGEFYDLFVEYSSTDSEYVKNIHKQLTLLT